MILARCIFMLMAMSVGVVAVAQDVQITGQITQTIQLPNTTRQLNAEPVEKDIVLLRLQLSDRAQRVLDTRLKQAMSSDMQIRGAKHKVPKSIQLGMGSVPVLEQGSYGTCVTFANIAAIDAALNKGDYYSELCPLQLSRHLENVAYTINGWDGSLGPIVLNQLTTFGLVSKTEQRANGCGGLTEYPSSRNDGFGTEMTISEYHQISKPINECELAWSSLFDPYQVFDDKMDMNRAMDLVKAALEAGDRITFGTLLPDTKLGIVGAVGKHQANNDTWILTHEIAEARAKELAGHEMIITGYDDDAIATDSKGQTYKGLFTLRNSWGPFLGDKGDFYMSYDYFKTLAVEAQRIRHFDKKQCQKSAALVGLM